MQAEQLLGLPEKETLKGKRDAVLLWLFVTAGLRREELATLLIEQIQQRDGRWCRVDLVGKGGRVRTVAIPAKTKEVIEVWLAAVPFAGGLLLGKVNKGGRLVGQGMTAEAISSPMPRGSGSCYIRTTCGGRTGNWRTRAGDASSRSNSLTAMPRLPPQNDIWAWTKTWKMRPAIIWV